MRSGVVLDIIRRIVKSSVTLFLLRRTAFFLFTYFIAITIVFILPRVIPGNPLALLLTRIFQQMQTNPEQVKAVYRALAEEFDINKPILQQYIDFLSRTFRGDLGTSIAFYPRKVIELIISALPWTLALLIPSTLTAWFIGNTLGAIAGYRRGSRFEKTLLTASFILSATPYYWFAMIMLFVFSVRLGLFPTGGGYTRGLVPTLSSEFILNILWHYTLPYLTMVLVGIGGWAIGMRALTIYEVGSDYIVFLESLGTRSSIIFRYTFRNSLLPQVTGLALSIGSILGGSLITEVVFNYPGTGYILFTSLISLDYPTIQGVFIILIATLFLANFLVDFVYAIIDPRIRLVSEGR